MTEGNNDRLADWDLTIADRLGGNKTNVDDYQQHIEFYDSIVWARTIGI